MQHRLYRTQWRVMCHMCGWNLQKLHWIDLQCMSIEQWRVLRGLYVHRCVYMQPWILRPRWWTMHSVSSEFRPGRHTHGSQHLCMQRWIHRTKRRKLYGLCDGNIQICNWSCSLYILCSRITHCLNVRCYDMHNLWTRVLLVSWRK